MELSAKFCCIQWGRNVHRASDVADDSDQPHLIKTPRIYVKATSADGHTNRQSKLEGGILHHFLLSVPIDRTMNRPFILAAIPVDFGWSLFLLRLLSTTLLLPVVFRSTLIGSLRGRLLSLLAVHHDVLGYRGVGWPSGSRVLLLEGSVRLLPARFQWTATAIECDMVYENLPALYIPVLTATASQSVLPSVFSIHAMRNSTVASGDFVAMMLSICGK